MRQNLRRWLAVESDELFHVDMETLSIAERMFVHRCREHMRRVHRPSWPDFIVAEDARVYAVEVKTPADGLSDNQIRTFDLLHPILPVYVWLSSDPGRLLAWPNARGAVKRR